MKTIVTSYMIKDNLTIIIPCKNEENYIINTLKSIEKQVDIFGTKVLIADAASTDSTLELVDGYKKHSVLDIEVVDGGNVAFGRNSAAKIATTKYLLFLDADSIIESDETIKKCLFEMSNYDIIGCKIKCSVKDIKAELMFSLFNFVQPLMPETFCCGMFMFVKTSIFKQIGGFDETLHQSEDYFFSKQIAKDKFKVISEYVFQDNRRFKKIGYWFMVKLLITNYINKNNINYFRRDINYWK